MPVEIHSIDPQAAAATRPPEGTWWRCPACGAALRPSEIHVAHRDGCQTIALDA